MSDFDLDQFENTAAFLEYCDGMTRFQAETEAARRQGVARHDAIRMGHSAQARHHGATTAGDATDNLPGVQPRQAQQAGSVPIGDIQAGRDSVDVLALSVGGGRVL